ncbi:MAG: type II secretion system F family protein [Acidimicrobiales bacterium]
MSATYAYTAYDVLGAKDTGHLDASSLAEAKTTLRERGLLVIELAERRAPIARREITLGGRKVKAKDVAWMARQLATTQSAGLDVVRAIGILARQRPGAPIGQALSDIHTRIASGSSTREAFAAHESDFGPLCTALVGAGEEGGQLDDALSKLADITEARVRLRQKVRSALAYPVMVMFAVAILVLVMLVFIVPAFAKIYHQLHGHLPLQTRLLISISNTLLGRPWVFLLVIAGIFVAWRVVRSRRDLRKRLDGLSMRLPAIGPLLTQSAMARVEATLASLLLGGVPLLDAVEHAVAVAGNLVWADALSDAAARVRGEGLPFSSALGTHPEIPEVLSQLVAVGEETGQLPNLLDRHATETEKQVSVAVDGLTALIEPALIIFMGIVIGGILISLYLPIIKVVTLIH